MTIQEIETVYITEQQRLGALLDNLTLSSSRRAQADFIKEVAETFGDAFFLHAIKKSRTSSWHCKECGKVKNL